MLRERMTRRGHADPARAGPHHASADRVPRGGVPLDGATRGYMEARFNYNFADVRVHDGADADRSAGSLGARAYTAGSDVYFRQGMFAPDTVGGAHLLAHELTHVVQQGRGGARLPARAVSDARDGAEAEAAHAADVAIAGGAVSVVAPAGAAIARSTEEDHGPAGTFSTLSSLLGFPSDAGLLDLPFMTVATGGGFGPSAKDGLGFLSPLAGALGTVTSADRALTGFAAGDYLKGGSGLLGTAGGISSLAGWFGDSTALGGVGGLLGAGGSALDAVSDFAHGNYGQGAYDTAKAAGGTLSGLASLGGFQLTSEIAGTGAMEALLGGGGEGLAALGPAGLVMGAGLAGAGVGTMLYNDTTVGEHSQGALGTIDGWLTGDGERSWMERTAEAAGDDWDNGDYLGAIGNGLELGGVGLAGAIGGLAGGAVDLVGDIGSGIGSVWDSIWD